MGVRNVGCLERTIAGRASSQETILVSQALHEQRVSRIAGQITARKGTVRLVLIAGPSSSGKTTFSKRLGIQLLASGLRPFPLELDNYFVEREKTPRDENGNYDFESLNALDLRLFNNDLLNLLEGQEVTLPRYNFHTGLRETGPTVRLRPDHILIVEGIHGLNPDLLPNIPAEVAFRVTCRHLHPSRTSTSHTGPPRHPGMIRTYSARRGLSRVHAPKTIDRWESCAMARNADSFLFRNMPECDVQLGPGLELSVLKTYAQPLLLSGQTANPSLCGAKRLLPLEWFQPLGAELIPDNSILREFIGGSDPEGNFTWPVLSDVPVGTTSRSRVLRQQALAIHIRPSPPRKRGPMFGVRAWQARQPFQEWLLTTQWA